MLAYTSTTIPLSPYFVRSHAQIEAIYADVYDPYTWSRVRGRLLSVYPAYQRRDDRRHYLAVEILTSDYRLIEAPIDCLRNIVAFVGVEVSQ